MLRSVLETPRVPHTFRTTPRVQYGAANTVGVCGDAPSPDTVGERHRKRFAMGRSGVSGPARQPRRGTITRLRDAIRHGERTASAVVTASIERLIEVNPALNVLAESAFDDALASAAGFDTGPRTGGALAGVPTLIKDLEDWAGHPTRQGSRVLLDAANATSNGLTPQRLLDAGAIVLGKSTLPEFAIEGYTANELTGVTRNPWNLELSPGGSSGGSAAALAAGLVAVATATDGGGSVRIPASLCGLVGLKPTNGAIGRYPEPDWIDYSTDGPFATSADDLELVYRVMAGPVAGDPTALPASGLDSLERWRDEPLTLVGAPRTSPWGPLAPDVDHALHGAVAAIADLLGAPVTWMEPEDFFEGGDPDLDWYVTCATEHVHRLGREFVEANWDDLHVATREFFAMGLSVSAEQYLAARRRRFGYVRVLDELLGANGLLLTPVVTSSGWPADGSTDDGSVHGLAPQNLATVIQNITGLPALSVPMGHLDTGLPFGLQVTAPRYHDRRLLDLAALVESAHPWARSAPGYPTLAETLELD